MSLVVARIASRLAVKEREYAERMVGREVDGSDSHDFTVSTARKMAIPPGVEVKTITVIIGIQFPSLETA